MGQTIAVVRRRRVSQSAQGPDALGPGVTQLVQRDAHEELNRDKEFEETARRAEVRARPPELKAGPWEISTKPQAITSAR